MKTRKRQFVKLVYAGFFLLFTLCILNSKAQQIRLLTPDDGLSNSHITHIYQDSKGYIWIATEKGLNKFNGYDFEVYLSVPNDTTSIRANFVTHVYEDSRGLFWVATVTGLLRYDRTRNEFSRWRMGEFDELLKDRLVSRIFEDRNNNLWITYDNVGLVRLDAKTLLPVIANSDNTDIGANSFFSIFEDRHGNLWFGTTGNGIYVYNPQNNTAKHYHHHPDDPSGLSNNEVFSICENADGEIWAGTLGGGINVFDEKTQTFRVLETDQTTMENLTFSLLLDRDQNVWAGTDGAGIFKYDVHGNKTHYWEEVSSVVDLRTAKIHGIFQDRQGNIWAGLFQKGLLFISASGSTFQTIGFNPFVSSRSIGTHCVLSIIEDHQGNVWAGTDGDGLYRIHPSGNVDHFTTKNTPGFPEDIITALFEDKEHHIWIGTYLNGMFRYHTQTGKFDSHFKRTNSGNILSGNYVTDFKQDDDGNIWIGTNGGGVSLFNPKTRQFKQYLNYGDGTGDRLSNRWVVFNIIISHEKNIWAIANNGLNRFNKEKDIFEVFAVDINTQISSLMYTSQEDYSGNIWVGGNYGLYCFDKDTGTSSSFTTADGLPDNMITGILEDHDHFLWISTGKGLFRFNPETREINTFFAEDGIQSNEFRRRSHFKGKDDKMYFGGIKGITTFYPSRILYETPLLNLVFTDFSVNNELIKAGQSDILEKSLDETATIRLKYNQHSFVLSFTALEFGMPHRVSYFTQMENFETQWHQVSSSNRTAVYTNLNPGNYVFKVMATIDGNNILRKNVQIVIQPPWWWSIVAKIAYVALVFLLMYGIYAYLSWRASRRHRESERQRLLLEQTVEKRTEELVLAKDKAEESDKLKSAFLTNMSHEILTPLNGIVGFLKFFGHDDLSRAQRNEYLNIVNNSSSQLVTIINDIIDVSKIEVNQLTISPVPVDLNELMQEVWVFFKEHLQTNKKEAIRLLLDDSKSIDRCVICVDPIRLRQVLSNLISNAIKFTDEGFVRFGYRQSDPDLLEFVVEDTGIGLRNDQMEIIFERFRQADLGTELRRLYGGTGLGLTIARALVQMSGGTMWVDSTEGIGATFYFTIAYKPVKS